VDETAAARSKNGPSAFAAWSSTVSRDRTALRALLQESGLWTAFRTRPFSHVPRPDAEPHALFVTAIDTQPLAPNVDVIVAERADDFAAGLSALVAMTDAPVHLCRRAGSTVGDGVRNVKITDFAGKHPAGTVGYHIHMLAPVSRAHSVWHIGAQDVIRAGHLIRTGTLDTSQIIAMAGPLVREPRLLRTQVGASVMELIAGGLTRDDSPATGDARVLSGSVLTGRQVSDDITGYLGRFHQQVSVIPEDESSSFLGWVSPFTRSFSHLPVYITSWIRNGRRAFDTRLHGGQRAMVPIGAYERVMPMDIMPTHLLRAITVGDTAWAEELGALELDEEDVALCTFVCPGKYDYGPALRSVLDQIAAEQ
jgi:Na+-transporting NADH:ubiquinone oxidoreductase subunit A